VLITLAIIGIIAAITIPSIVANHQKRTLETQFAKAYRTITQAVNLAIAEHGNLDTWSWQSSWTGEEMDNFVKKYFSPYLNVVKFCPSEDSNAKCFADVTYTTKDGQNAIVFDARKEPRVKLADGNSIYFNFSGYNSDSTTWAISINIDTNGDKKPNLIGYDVHSFDILPQIDKFALGGLYYYDTNTFKKRTKEEIESLCLNNIGGWNCGVRMLNDGFKINY